MTVLQTKHLSLRYGRHFVFKDLSFSVDDKDFLCIVGPNGSGKSTLLKCILGEIKPSSGKILFKNGSKNHHIGYLPQNTELNPIFPASVYEIVASGVLNQIGPFTPYPKAKISSVLETLQLNTLKNKSFQELSGGQRQRVLLARALVASTDILILDEPSNNLDYKSKQDFYKILRKLNQTTTILMVTHDLDHHNLIGNKILSLDPNLPFFGSTSDYVRRIHAE
ncbi:ABC transporter ATP-binding protein [Candidatus Saccharibacteria bacterium]|nr:ABC transporter ATP-binding protein [Candidatus Saccharibacteria bacterium]